MGATATLSEAGLVAEPGEETTCSVTIRNAGQVVGCMSPCKRWNYSSPYGLSQPESVDPGLHLCCPTPIDPGSANM